MNKLALILVAPDPDLCAAWRKHFHGLRDVEIVAGRFQALRAFDCMVSAANSFGLMDGGVDAAIIEFFGHALMAKVQQQILDEYLGEQPVGTAMIVETNHPQHPFIVHTPTMRVPMRISRTDAVYRAMWGMLLAVRRHNQNAGRHIGIVACPGLGTGTGEVPYPEAARQMALAYRNFVNPPRNIDWKMATRRQNDVGGT